MSEIGDLKFDFKHPNDDHRQFYLLGADIVFTLMRIINVNNYLRIVHSTYGCVNSLVIVIILISKSETPFL